MERETVKFNGEELTIYKSAKDILFDTADICGIAGIPYEDRIKGTDLGVATVDMVSAVRATQPYHPEFSEWLAETFIGYNVEVLIRPNNLL